MKRKYVAHRTAAGLMYATFEKPKKRFDAERFIDNCMTAILTGFIWLLLWYGASVVLPGVIG